MQRKLLPLTLVFLMCLALTACAGNQVVQCPDADAPSSNAQTGNIPDTAPDDAQEQADEDAEPTAAPIMEPEIGTDPDDAIVTIDNDHSNTDSSHNAANDDAPDTDSQDPDVVASEHESQQEAKNLNEAPKSEADIEKEIISETSSTTDTEPGTKEDGQDTSYDVGDYAYFDLDGVLHDGGSVTDTDDPHAGMPGYEGPKEGYEWNVVRGYYKKDEVAKETQKIFDKAEEMGVNYYDFQGHLMAYEEHGGDGYDYAEWIANHQEYVLAYCERSGCSYQEYLEDNHVA